MVMRRCLLSDRRTVEVVGAHGQGRHVVRAPCIGRFCVGTAYVDALIVGWVRRRDQVQPVTASISDPADRSLAPEGAELADLAGWWEPGEDDGAAAREGERLRSMVLGDDGPSGSSAAEGRPPAKRQRRVTFAKSAKEVRSVAPAEKASRGSSGRRRQEKPRADPKPKGAARTPAAKRKRAPAASSSDSEEAIPPRRQPQSPAPQTAVSPSRAPPTAASPPGEPMSMEPPAPATTTAPPGVPEPASTAPPRASGLTAEKAGLVYQKVTTVVTEFLRRRSLDRMMWRMLCAKPDNAEVFNAAWGTTTPPPDVPDPFITLLQEAGNDLWEGTSTAPAALPAAFAASSTATQPAPSPGWPAAPAAVAASSTPPADGAAPRAGGSASL